MYGFAGVLENRTEFSVYCAYSAPNPDGGNDIWKVSILYPVSASEGVDIDYIRTCNRTDYLCWAGGFGGIVKNPKLRTNNWVKVRQLVTTTIVQDDKRPTLGFLGMETLVFGTPADALKEAKSYNGGWRESSRGTDAVKNAITEWDGIITGKTLSQMAQVHL